MDAPDLSDWTFPLMRAATISARIKSCQLKRAVFAAEAAE